MMPLSWASAARRTRRTTRTLRLRRAAHGRDPRVRVAVELEGPGGQLHGVVPPPRPARESLQRSNPARDTYSDDDLEGPCSWLVNPAPGTLRTSSCSRCSRRCSGRSSTGSAPAAGTRCASTATTTSCCASTRCSIRLAPTTRRPCAVCWRPRSRSTTRTSRSATRCSAASPAGSGSPGPLSPQEGALTRFYRHLAEQPLTWTASTTWAASTASAPDLRQRDEGVFHEPGRRARSRSASLVLGRRCFNTDEFRHAIERLDPVAYLADGYFGRWLGAIELLVHEAAGIPFRSASTTRPRSVPSARPRASPGASVVAATCIRRATRRLPGYVRSRRGTVVLEQGVWVLPDTNAHGRRRVSRARLRRRFDGRELWGDDAEPGTSVTLDLFESYLEPHERRDPRAIRTEALERLLTERGLVAPEAIDAILRHYEEDVGPLNGARMVARAWLEPGPSASACCGTGPPPSPRWASTAPRARAGRGREHAAGPQRGRVHAVLLLPVAGAGAAAGLVQGPGLPVAHRAGTAQGPRGVRAWSFQQRSRCASGIRAPRSATWCCPGGRTAPKARTRTRWPPGSRATNDRRGEVRRMSVERVLPQEGPAARRAANGELQFEAPWESRIFGITLALLEQGRFAWPEFQARLIEAIARMSANAATRRTPTTPAGSRPSARSRPPRAGSTPRRCTTWSTSSRRGPTATTTSGQRSCTSLQVCANWRIATLDALTDGARASRSSTVRRRRRTAWSARAGAPARGGTRPAREPVRPSAAGARCRRRSCRGRRARARCSIRPGLLGAFQSCWFTWWISPTRCMYCHSSTLTSLATPRPAHPSHAPATTVSTASIPTSFRIVAPPAFPSGSEPGGRRVKRLRPGARSRCSARGPTARGSANPRRRSATR